MAEHWRPEARDFNDFKQAIKEALDDKQQDSKWIVGIEVRKKGNPVHDYRIILRPA
jgi:hypothetical protein